MFYYNKSGRRKFIKLSAASATILGLPFKDKLSIDSVVDQFNDAIIPPFTDRNIMRKMPSEPMDKVRVALIGLGNRGHSHTKQLAALAHKAEIKYLCDIEEKKVKEAKKLLNNKGSKVKTYYGKPHSWKKMLENDDIDLVIVSTPWSDHAEMCIESMKSGKHVAVEVPAAFTFEECWSLIQHSEKTKKHCIMLENVCYGDEELWILNMLKNKIFGTITYAECAYIHDLRELMFSKTYYYNQWRLRHHITDDSNLYPTHGLGPVAQYMDISRGDRFDKLVSMSSLEAGLTEYSQQVEKDNEFFGRKNYAHGDMNMSFIKTDKGKTILVQHDVVTPRPYNRINALAGTKAYHEGYPSRLSLNDYKHGHRWLPDEQYNDMRKKYKHPIWTELEDEIAKNGGHGGMDFVMLYRLIDNFNKGLPPDMDVYDAMDWSVVVPLSKLSVELGNVPLQFPDFIDGQWKTEDSLQIMK